MEAAKAGEVICSHHVGEQAVDLLLSADEVDATGKLLGEFLDQRFQLESGGTLDVFQREQTFLDCRVSALSDQRQ